MIMLNVKAHNTKARKLYENCGFVWFFQGPTDCIYTMQLNIPADKLPQGNIIQRHKKIAGLIAASALGGLIWWKYIR